MTTRKRKHPRGGPDLTSYTVVAPSELVDEFRRSLKEQQDDASRVFAETMKSYAEITSQIAKQYEDLGEVPTKVMAKELEQLKSVVDASINSSLSDSISKMQSEWDDYVKGLMEASSERAVQKIKDQMGGAVAKKLAEVKQPVDKVAQELARVEAIVKQFERLTVDELAKVEKGRKESRAKG